MATKGDVQKLAALARIEVADADLDAFVTEFDAIIAYVGQLEQFELTPEVTKEKPELRNVMRPDTTPHETGKYTEKIVAQFPAKKGDALSVRQIISHD